MSRPKIILRCTQTPSFESESHTSSMSSDEQSSEAGITPLSSIGTATVKTTELRCDPDPFYPGLAFCTAEVDDDRQGISHFFGRNKKATASISQHCFPLMCRVHYQEKGYRWGRQSPGILADFQCGCIVKTLKNMAKIVFKDEHGNTWPWFCGLTLQIPMPKVKKPSQIKLLKTRNSNADKQDPRADDGDVDPEGRRRYETSLDNLPAWLRHLVTKHPCDTRYDNDEHRNGVKYNISQVISIVRLIGKYCVDNKVQLPRIEAIPATLGMHFEQELEKVKKEARDLMTKRDRAVTELRNASTATARDNAGEKLGIADDLLTIAEDALYLAQLDFDATAHMVPATRITRRRIPSKSLVQTELPTRNRNESDKTPVSRTSAAKATKVSEENNLSTRRDQDVRIDASDDGNFTDDTENDKVTQRLEEANPATIAEDMVTDELEEGEILEDSVEVHCIPPRPNYVDTTNSSSNSASRVFYGRKRKLADIDNGTVNERSKRSRRSA